MRSAIFIGLYILAKCTNPEYVENNTMLSVSIIFYSCVFILADLFELKKKLAE